MSLFNAVSRKACGNLLRCKTTSISSPVLFYHPNVRRIFIFEYILRDSSLVEKSGVRCNPFRIKIDIEGFGLGYVANCVFIDCTKTQFKQHLFTTVVACRLLV